MEPITTPVDWSSEIREQEKLLRIVALSRAMLEEARSATCDAAGCK